MCWAEPVDAFQVLCGCKLIYPTLHRKELLRKTKKAEQLCELNTPILFWKHLASEHFIHSFGLFGEKPAQALAAFLSNK